MDSAPESISQASRLPAARLGPDARLHVDYRAVIGLAAPLFLNSGMQAVLNLTDTWFLGHISAHATAAVGAVYWYIILFVLLFGGVGMAVQTLVAQAYGAGERRRAAEVTWSGLWAALMVAPLFVAVAFSGRPLVSPFGLEPAIEALALQFWFPRLLGGIAGVALWSLSSFFNGIGRTRITLAVMLSVAAANALLNQLFIFHLHLGVAGSAWATGAAQLFGVGIGLAVFLSADVCKEFHAHACWRPDWRTIRRTFSLGLPMGMLPAADLLGLALFQLMQARTGTIGGAATQIVMMMTSIAYMPAIGIASAGTTLVGQSIGAGDRDWAARVGNAALKVTVAYMGLVSLVLALAGPWLLPLFITPGDAFAQRVIAMSYMLLWIAAGYQIFDGFNLGGSFSLRGAGDVRVPMLMIVVLSWGGFIPLTHMLTFAPGEGLVHFLPQFGFGAVGGWSALLIYTFALGMIMFLRWRSGAWRKIVL